MSEIGEIINKSVTKDNYGDVKNGVFVFVGLSSGLILPASGMPVHPPAWWSFERDDVLRITLHYESMWANAIYTAITRTASLSLSFKGPIPLQVRRAQELIREADPGYGNRSKTTFLQRHLRDYLMTDNGAFIEIIRATPATGSKILGLKHLDSRRCRRTGDPDIPVIYRDKMNNWHEMKRHQVITMSDLPDPSEMYYGVGYCAASRAYRKVYEMSALETYVSEKVVGQRPLALYFVSGASQTQIDNMINSAKSMAQGQGYSSYMGAAVTGMIDPNAQASVAKVDLAGLPDRFEPEQERSNAYLVYADAIGIDPQELDPKLVSSHAMGTGSQAKVIDDKASGKGLAGWQTEFLYNLNEYVFPETVYVTFTEKDLRDLTAKAQLSSLRTQAVATMIQSQLITPEQGTQMLVDSGDIPEEFQKVDLTTSLTLMDDDKPDSVGKPNPDMMTPQDMIDQQNKQDMKLRKMEMQQRAQQQPPEGLQGGNPMMQTARQDQFKELADLRLEQAFKEIDILKSMSNDIQENKEEMAVSIKEVASNPPVVNVSVDNSDIAAALEKVAKMVTDNRPIVKIDMQPVADAIRNAPAPNVVVTPTIQVEVPLTRKRIVRDTQGRMAEVVEESLND